MASIFGETDLFPSWVADMDFKVAPSIVERLSERAAHGVFGYEYPPDGLYDAVLGWFAARHAWAIDAEHLLVAPNVLNAIAVAIELFSTPGEGIILQPPVFFDFKLILKNSKRRLVKNPLRLVDGVYQIDFEDLEAKAANPATKILILCNPHNPVGRVWTRQELQRVADICLSHDVLVISDDIHADIVFPEHRYTPIASLSRDIAANTVTCLSPAKSFNLAACCSAFMVIADQSRRQACKAFQSRFEMNKNNAFANVAMLDAYRSGGPWLTDVLAYIQGNVDLVRNYLAEHVPGVGMIEPQGTFMVWVDFRGLGLDAKALQHFLIHEARLGVNMGHWFGREGAGFARLNIACPAAVLEEALGQLATAVAVLRADAG
jgi:cystathionine beta-lyase